MAAKVLEYSGSRECFPGVSPGWNMIIEEGYDSQRKAKKV